MGDEDKEYGGRMHTVGIAFRSQGMCQCHLGQGLTWPSLVQGSSKIKAVSSVTLF